MTAVTAEQRGRVAGREHRRTNRLLEVAAWGDMPKFSLAQQSRPGSLSWPQTCLNADEVIDMTSGLAIGSKLQRRYGVRRLLGWLTDFPGETWQQGWKESGAEQAGIAWPDLVPRGGGRGAGTADSTGMRLGIGSLLIGQVIRPDMAWLSDQDFSTVYAPAFVAIDPRGWDLLQRHLAGRPATPPRPTRKSLNAIARILISKGGPLTTITAGDCAEYWWTRRERGLHMHEGRLFYALLFELGIFGADAPPNLISATRPGQLSCAELVDRYDIASVPIRQLLVDYLAVRRPSMDYTSLRNLASNLCRLFWKDLEDHNPGINSLHLAPDVAEAWKQRLKVTVFKPRNGVRERMVPEYTLMHVLRFYGDIAQWATEEPQRWGPFAAPCPVRPAETSLTKQRKRRKAAMDQRTRILAPILPTLVRVVETEHAAAKNRLAVAAATAHGEHFALDGITYQRKATGAAGGPVVAIAPDTGEAVDLTSDEERTFWAWAVVETLRHTGIRIEEMLELSHHSFCTYTLPTTAEIVPMLQVAPSKTDTERLLLISPELGEVLATVISRVRGTHATLPLISQWDGFERRWSPLMPFLFQRSVGGVGRQISRQYIRGALDGAMDTAGLNYPTGKPLRFTPHDFRRIFATDALRSGLPPHIAAKILGHVDLNVTLGYAAIYPEDVISHHRAFITRRRALRPSEEYRDLTPAEWDDFLGHFELRKVELGVCTRDFGTPCVHEHAFGVPPCGPTPNRMAVCAVSSTTCAIASTKLINTAGGARSPALKSALLRPSKSWRPCTR